MLIGQLAKRSGLSRDTIRYYEKLGLVPASSHASRSGYRIYDPDSLRRLADIIRLKKAGFTLREIGELASGKAPCHGLPERVRAKIQEVDRKLRELTEYRVSLARIESQCDENCSTTSGLPDCVVPSNGGCCG